MLPFGLTTDVSAGALAAGGGGALGGVPASGGAITDGNASGFLEELKAVAGKANALDAGAAAQAPVPESALQALQQAKTTTDLPEGPVPGQEGLPETSPGATLAYEDLPLPTEEAALDTLAAGEAGLPGAPANMTLAALAPAHMGAAISSAASVETSVVPQVDGRAAGPAGVLPAAGGQAAPGAAGLASGSGSSALSPVPPAQAAAAGASLPGADGGAQPAASKGAPSAPLPASGGLVQQAAAPAGRRWQTELPQEFRAPPTVPVQTRSAGAQSIETQLTAVAAADTAGIAATGVKRAPIVQVNATAQPAAEGAQPVTGSQTPGQAQAAVDTLLKTPAATQQPVANEAVVAKRADGQAPAAPLPSGQAAVTPGQIPVVAPVVSPGQGQGQGQTQAPVATGELLQPATPEQAAVPELDAEGNPLPVKPVSAEVSSAPGVKPGTGNGAGGPGPANADAGPDATRTAATGVAAPVAAAAAAPLLSEEADLPLSVLEPGTGSEFSTATVRGGDMSGAMRTESLQTPNQTQSTHVATQVAAEIVRNLKNGQTQFQMRFDPPELGRVEVNMRVGADGSVQAHLIVDRPETLDMFLRDQRGLERALEAAGLNPDSDNLQFSLKQEGGQDMAGDQDNRHGPGGSDDGGVDGTGEPDPDLGDRVRLMLAEQRGGLDMKV